MSDPSAQSQIWRVQGSGHLERPPLSCRWFGPVGAAVFYFSKAPFDVWVKERLLEFHGHAFVHAPRRAGAELIFAYPQVSESRPISFGEGSS
jgi:hypothetical protein